MSARFQPHPGKGTRRAAPKGQARKKTKTCPICAKPLSAKPLSGKPLSGRPEEYQYRPFCSKHCAEIDLGRWLDGRYAVQGAPVDKARADFDSEPDGDR